MDQDKTISSKIEEEDLASLDDTIGEETCELIGVVETMCRTIGTFDGNRAICIKDACNCKRHAYGKKRKEKILPGSYPAIRNHDGKLVGAEPPVKKISAPTEYHSTTPESVEMGKFFSEQSQPGLDNFDTESLDRDDFDNSHEMRGSYEEEFKQPSDYKKGNTPRTQNLFSKFKPREHVPTEGDLLRRLLRGVQVGDSLGPQGSKRDSSYYAVTGIPKPKVVRTLQEAQILAEQLDGHVSVFQSQHKAVDYINQSKNTEADLTEDLFKCAGIDGSVGKGKELFGHHITTDADLREFLLPNNVDEGTSNLLSDMMLDSLACPGAVRSGTNESHFEQLTSAMETIATGKRANDGGIKDLQWRNAKRTSLSSVKNEEDLSNLLERLMEEQPEILEKRTTMISSCLVHHAGWTPEKATLHGKLCLLNRIGHDTYNFYVGFIIHLLRVSVREGWQLAEVEIKLFLEKTDSSRGNNMSRLCALAEIYCHIRDLQKNRWRSLQLLERRMTAQPPTNSQGSGPGVCGHCGTSIHPGGRKKCPLKHLKSSEAQTKILGFFQKQFSEED